jgi:hypothetical protein
VGEKRDRVATVSDLESVEKRLDSKIDSKIADVLAVVAAEGEKTRRHFDVVAEQVRAEFKVVIDKTTATGGKVDRLIAQSAIEHAAFVEAIAATRSACACWRR